MAKEDRGFASMDPEKRREICSKGGRAAHIKGTAHEWSREEAREAGRKGALKAASRRKHEHVAHADLGLEPVISDISFSESGTGDH